MHQGHKDCLVSPPSTSTSQDRRRSSECATTRSWTSTPYDDGFEIMKDNQTAKPQAFRTGDGWFAYNLAVNLGQME